MDLLIYLYLTLHIVQAYFYYTDYTLSLSPIDQWDLNNNVDIDFGTRA